MTTVIRPAWSPDTDEQRKLLAEASRLARKERQTASAKWVTILRARLAGVPDEALCDHTEESRATLNRRFGSRRAMAVMWTGDNFDEVKTLRPDARLNADGDLEVERVSEPGVWVVVPLNYVVRREPE